VDVGPQRQGPISIAASPGTPPLSSTMSQASCRRSPAGLRGAAADACARLVMQRVVAPRFFASSAISTGTALRPELEKTKSASPAPGATAPCSSVAA